MVLSKVLCGWPQREEAQRGATSSFEGENQQGGIQQRAESHPTPAFLHSLQSTRLPFQKRGICIEQLDNQVKLVRR